MIEPVSQPPAFTATTVASILFWSVIAVPLYWLLRIVGYALEGLLWMVTTAFAGRLLNINAYDQPAVETGKLATFGLMGRAGYEQWQSKVDDTLGPAGKR